MVVDVGRDAGTAGLVVDMRWPWPGPAPTDRPARYPRPPGSSADARRRGQKPLHLISAFATTQRLVLAQEAVDEKENECGAIPDILDRIDVEGALVTIDAIACNPKIAAAITERKGDYILAVKANQPTIHNEITIFFADPASKTIFCSDIDKDHGRIETRRVAVSHEVGWLLSDRRYPDEPRFPTLAAIVMVESTIETKGTVTTERRYYISSATSPSTASASARENIPSKQRARLPGGTQKLSPAS